jgi:hypothetical protein
LPLKAAATGPRAQTPNLQEEASLLPSFPDGRDTKSHLCQGQPQKSKKNVAPCGFFEVFLQVMVVPRN